MPIGVLIALGRLDLMPYALLTSVISVYGRRAARAPRLAIQGQALTLQVLLLLLGGTAALGSPSPVVVVGLTAIIAGACTVIADLRRWTPPGALFFVFAFAVAASAPTGPNLGEAALTAASTAVFTLAVTLTFSRSTSRASAPTGTVPSRRVHVVVIHALMCTVGAAAAGWIAVEFGFTHPYWAIVSAVVPIVGHTTAGQTLRALHRVAGTTAGLLVAAAIFVRPMPVIVTVIILVALMTLTELFVARNYAVALLFLTPFTIGLLFLEGTVDLGTALATRGVETLIGAGIGMVLILMTHSVRHPSGDDLRTSTRF